MARPQKTTYPAPLAGDFEHGTPTGYNWHGCRCQLCTRWIRDHRHHLYVLNRGGICERDACTMHPAGAV